MTTNAPVTFINVIDVEPARQQELISLLKEGTEKVIRHQPGFVSVTLLASLDGTRVVNLAQWRSPDDIKATQGNPDARQYAVRTAELAKASPNVFSVIAEYHA